MGRPIGPRTTRHRDAPPSSERNAGNDDDEEGDADALTAAATATWLDAAPDGAPAAGPPLDAAEASGAKRGAGAGGPRFEHPPAAVKATASTHPRRNVNLPRATEER
jgi:hypothetical protein